MAVLSLYFETEHPILGVFDADLFIGDLVARRPLFCTSFLLSALMAWALVIVEHSTPI